MASVSPKMKTGRACKIGLRDRAREQADGRNGAPRSCRSKLVGVQAKFEEAKANLEKRPENGVPV